MIKCLCCRCSRPDNLNKHTKVGTFLHLFRIGSKNIPFNRHSFKSKELPTSGTPTPMTKDNQNLKYMHIIVYDKKITYLSKVLLFARLRK